MRISGWYPPAEELIPENGGLKAIGLPSRCDLTKTLLRNRLKYPADRRYRRGDEVPGNRRPGAGNRTGPKDLITIPK